ncbi:MAG: asparagine synthetase B family protein [Bacillota bacterium]
MISAFCGIVRFDGQLIPTGLSESMYSQMPSPLGLLTVTKKLPTATMTAAEMSQSDEALSASSGTSLEFGDYMSASYKIRDASLTLTASWGFVSLYYLVQDGFVAFSTHPNAFFAIPDVTLTPNIDQISRVLESRALDVEKTFYNEISQVRPGSKTVILQSEIKTTDLCNFKENRAVDSRNDSELGIFYNVFREAIQKRIVSKTATTLSAGLDSSAITAITADLLGENECKLLAITSSPKYTNESFAPDGCLNDESELASQVTSSRKNIKHLILKSDGADIVASIQREVQLTGRPSFSPANFFWIEDVVNCAANEGYKRLLIGQCGNGTISWSPTMPRLLPKSRFFPNTPFNKYLKVAKYRLKNTNILRNSQLETIKMHSSMFDFWYHLSLRSGIEILDPTLDKTLIETLLAFPENAFYRDGVSRRLIRKGLKGLLPEKILSNKKRGQQSSDIVARAKRQTTQINDALDQISQSAAALKLLDIPRLREINNKIFLANLIEMSNEDFKKLDTECTVEILRGLSVGFFLLKFLSKN